MKIGTLGAGEVAQALAIHLLKAGHEVLFSNSRGPSSLTQLVSKLGKGASLRHYLKAVIPTAELKPDQDRLRRVVLDLHTNQVIDNLILAQKESKLLCQRS